MIRSKINKYIYGMFFLSALLTTACQEEDIVAPLPGIPTGDAGEVILNFTVAGELSAIAEPTSIRSQAASPRTDLPGSDNIQHVTSVQLYIFNGTDDNALCVASEDVDWTGYFAGVPPTTTSTMRYRVKYQGLIKNTPYTFLAVGMDPSSGSTYGFPAAIQVGSTVLSNAIATLSGSESANWTKMRQSELFAGSTVLTPVVLGVQGNIDLWRRVAGVMGWFNNVPPQIDGDNVSAILITLYTQQNKSVPLFQRSQTPVFKDFIASPLASSTNGQVLVQIAVPAGTSLATVLSKGSYVLPIPAPASVNNLDYTLKVDLTNASGKVLKSTRVTLSGNDDTNSSTGNGTGVIDPQGVFRFPIIANRFYGIGTKTAPINLGGITTRNVIMAKELTEWQNIE